MGKASSSKKVARAARAGGRSAKGPKRQWGYPIGIAVIVVVGLMAVLFARNDNQQAAAETPTTVQHWHTAYGIYVCDAFLSPLTDQVQDATGLHTHGDGIAHIHPFGSGSAAKKDTLANWRKTTGLTFTSAGFTVTSTGTTYENGYDCNGQPATVSLYVWPADDTSAEPRIYTGSDIGKFHFYEDRLAVALAVVPEGIDVPRPDSVPELDQLSDVAGATSTTVASGTTGTTAAPTTEAP